jgi:hypothetical protein
VLSSVTEKVSDVVTVLDRELVIRDENVSVVDVLLVRDAVSVFV